MGRYTIPAVNLGRLQDKLATLNRRASRLGCAPITLTVGESHVRTVYNDLGIEVYPWKRTYIDVIVEGDAPSLSGWQFIAKIVPTEGKNIVLALPTVDDVPRFAYTVGMICEHCGKDRRRNEVFLIQDKHGVYRVVGRNCLADFLGGTDPEVLARRAEWLIDVRGLTEEAEHYGGTFEDSVETLGFLTVVAAIARHQGFVSRAQAQQNYCESTADLAWDYERGSRYVVEMLEESGFEVTKRDHEQAESAMAWVRGIENPEGNYMMNLTTACGQATLDRRAKGIVASAISAYKRHLESETARKAAPVRKHVGTVGKRLTTAAKVVTIREFDSYYGVRRLVRFEDNDGNVLVWWTSSWPNFDEGDSLTITGTVKEHGSYNDEPQTTLTRVKEA